MDYPKKTGSTEPVDTVRGSREPTRRVLLLVVGAIYLALHLLAAHLTSPRLWGVDSWRYIPLPYAYALFFLGLLALLPAVQIRAVVFLEGIRKSGDRLLFYIWLPLSIATFYLLRQKVPLLGDGLLRARNVEIGCFFSATEPLDTLIHTSIYSLLKPLLALTGQDVYRWTSILCGLLSLWALGHYLRKLYQDSGGRWVLGGLLLTMGSMQLYFGYVESYTMAHSLLFISVLSTMLMLKQGRLSRVPALTLSLAIATHPLTILYLPGTIYAYFRILGRPRAGIDLILPWLRIIALIVLPPALTAAALVVIGRSVPVEASGIQSLTEYLLPLRSNGETYGIFSWPHLADLFNELSLLLPALVIVPHLLVGRRLNRLSPEVAYLSLCAIGPLLLLMLFKPELGFSRDWDIFTILALPVTALLGLILLNMRSGPRHQATFALVVISLLHTGPWIYLNSSEKQSVERFALLINTPSWSVKAEALALDALADHYSRTGDLVGQAESDARAYRVSRNPRSFANASQGFYKLGDIGQLEMLVAEGDQFALGHYHLGLAYLQRGGSLEDALRELERAVELDSGFQDALMRLGRSYLDHGLTDRLLIQFKSILEKPLEPATSAIVHNIIGNALYVQGKLDEALDQVLIGLEYSPESPSTHYNLANIYQTLGEHELARQHKALAKEYERPGS